MSVIKNFTPDIFMVDYLDMTSAGSEIVEQPFNYVAFLRAEDSSGAPTAEAEVYLELGDLQGVRVPMGPGDVFPLPPSVMVEKCKIVWAAHPSVGKVYLFFSADGFSRPKGESPAKIASGTMTVDTITNPVNVGNFPSTFPDGMTEITRKGYSQIGASYYGGTVGSGTTTLVSAASNTGGLIVRTAWFNASSGNGTLFADTAAGSAYNDYTKRALWTLAGTNPTEMWPIKDLYIPSGNGLFLVNTSTFYVQLTYDLL